MNLTKKLNRITNKNLGKDAKAGYKEYEVELPEEPAQSSESEVDLGGDESATTTEDEPAMETLDEDVKHDL